MKVRRRAVPAVLALFILSMGGSVEAASTWAPAGTATIHPGVQVISASGQCTANFVFYDAEHVYIGQAAHCTSTGGQTDTNGCIAGSLSLGTPITIQGASRPGTMVYNSWLAMQAVGESDLNTCSYNDFALVRIDPADVPKVNPSVPHWGGPAVGVSPGTIAGEQVYSYGNSSLRLGLTVVSPKRGVSLGDTGGGWSHVVYTVTPGIPGDSGSAFLDSRGRALGVLSTVQLLPYPAANGVSNLGRALTYLRTHGGPAVEVALGTEPFMPGKLPLKP